MLRWMRKKKRWTDSIAMKGEATVQSLTKALVASTVTAALVEAGELVGVLEVVDAVNGSFTYDEANRQIAVENAKHEFQRTAYYPDGQVLAQIDDDGNRTTTVYDPAARPMRVEHPDVDFCYRCQ
mgnify:CR=1 FL=1